MSRFLSWCVDFFIYSNLFISIAACSLAMATSVLFNNEIVFLPSYAILFFSTLFEYNLSRVVSVSRAEQSYELRLAETWTSKNLYIHYVLLAVALAGLGYFFLYLSAINKIIFSLLGLITIAYTLPIIPSGKKFLRLRELPLIKVILVAIVWAMATTVPTYFENGNTQININVALIILQRMLFIFAITIPFDIRDTGRDQESDIITIPIKYGNRFALRMCLFAMCLFVLLEGVRMLLDSSITSLNIAVILHGLLTFLVLYYKPLHQWKYYHYGLLDGLMLLYFLLIYASTII